MGVLQKKSFILQSPPLIMMMMKKKNIQRDYEFMIRLQMLLEDLVFSRHLHLHLLPLLSTACACWLLLFAALSFLSPPISNHHLPLHATFHDGGGIHTNVEKQNVFRIPKRGGSSGPELWTSHQSKFFYGCSNASNNFITAGMSTQPDRYLLITTSGGLNQQRTGIIDAVVAAYLLNATLVVPNLDRESFWNDSSNFSDIFDVDWFITYLSKDVKIIKQLPEKAGKVITTHVPRNCDPECYQTRILPIFDRKRVVHLTKFDYRLSNWLDTDLQKLRCRVNYHALRFTHPILAMGRKLVERMRTKSKHFLALHLRFEADMLAFSGCYYGGGEKEMKELGEMRKRWITLHKKDPDRERRQGKCPLSPEEVGVILRALGYGNEVHIYVASGEIYGGEAAMAPLRALFPNIHTKESLGSKEELAEFSAYSSRMAALDFIVCYQSDVFVSNNNGNMAKILGGRRRYFGGQKPTIRPNAKKLNRLLVKRNKMRWEEFASQVRTFQIGFMGEMEIETGGSGSSLFHENPLSCICTNSTENKSTRRRYDDEDDLLFLEDLSGYDDDDDDGIPRRLDGGRN